MTALLISTFTIGYIAIAMEHKLKINKAATALMTGVLCWVIYVMSAANKELVTEQLTGHLGELSGILFFLMGAMTIVELIDAHDGFDIITTRITSSNKRQLLWIISLLTFFLSPVLDNLTTTIVMVSLTRKLIKAPEERLIFAGMTVIAANAGGAWSPIGDVTTTMLWLGGQVTAGNIVSKLFLPSLACLLVPLTILSLRMRGKVERPDDSMGKNDTVLKKSTQYIVLLSGILILLLVPVFKMVTHLPPYMGILVGLGILWIITEIIHGRAATEDRQALSVAYALQKIDTPSILFFLGLLMSIAALQVTSVLSDLALQMDKTIANEKAIVVAMGLLSSVVDNVPLIAASQGMYSLSQYPTDHFFWEFLAYCTGTGGSMLIIGSAAGVAAMGMEQISFVWYLKKISIVALLGFVAGIGVFFLQQVLF